jgi:hypothetical protein
MDLFFKASILHLCVAGPNAVASNLDPKVVRTSFADVTDALARDFVLYLYIRALNTKSTLNTLVHGEE